MTTELDFTIVPEVPEPGPDVLPGDPGGYGFPYGGLYGGVPPEAEIFIDAALERVLEQYKEQPNIDKLLRIFVARWQSLENLLQSVLTFRLLDTATGFLLAVYGKLLALPRRAGWSDDQWRFFLKLKIMALRSSGTMDELLAIGDRIRDFSGSTAIVRFFPEYPKGWRMEIPDVAVELRDLAAEIVAIATAAPERFVLVFYSSTVGSFAFRAPGTTHGFGHGRFAHSVTNGV